MIRQFKDHTCISISLVLNHHFVTPFPTMNKTLPKSLSIVDDTKCTELPTKTENDGINNSVDTEPSELSSHSMADDTTRTQPIVKYHYNDVSSIPGGCGSLATQLLHTLQEAVMKRVTLIPDGHKLLEQQIVCPQSKQDLSCCTAYSQLQVTTWSDARVAILFSGGVDSMVLAALADRQEIMLVFHWLFSMTVLP